MGDGAPPRLVLRFAVLTALALALAGAAIFAVLRANATERAQEAAGVRARSVAYTLLRERLVPSDFAKGVGGARRAALDALFTRQVLVEGARTVRVKLWSRDGVLVYSNVHSLIGQKADSPRIARALNGETVLHVGTMESAAGGSAKVLQTYVPVRLGGTRPSGAFEAYEDYTPVAGEIREAVMPVAIVLGAALLGLYVLLVPILRRVTRTLADRNRRLAEKTASLELLEAVAVAANESSTVDEATRICLDLVCAHMHWPVGHVYLRAGCEAELLPTTTWHLDDPMRFECFRVVTESSAFHADDGLPGHVLATGEPKWIADVTQAPDFLRAEAAAATGLRCAFAFPILVGSEVAGVLEVFGTEPVEPDETALEVMVHVGTQLGRVIERTRVADEALRESEARFRAVFEQAAVGIVMTDVSGRIAACNSTFRHMLGYTERELHGMSSSALVEPEDTASDERRYRHKDGMLVWGRVAASVIHDAAGRPQFEVAMVENITGQKELEEQLRQSQKMDAVGQLAGGVAHDFNNLLTVISGYTSLLLDGDYPPESARAKLRAIETAAEQAASLTGQLLAFSRKQMLQPAVLDLNTVVADTETILSRLIGEDIALETDLDRELGLVKADPGQIGQIILNLAVNARDAMPGGGRLTIETANLDVDPAEGHHLGIAPGRYVTIAVCDTGQGMSEETQTRIFEPFFTTKEKGHGTGLGLATVYGVAAQSGGSVAVQSALGEGATLTVYLPRLEDAAVPAVVATTGREPVTGSETVLLVEDEAAVRSLVRDVLEGSGYRVLEAHDVDDALRQSRAHDGEIHALVTDVVLPGTSGPEGAELVMRERPGLKVIYVSGYTDHPIIRKNVVAPRTRFLQKPFSPETLLRTLRTLLDDTVLADVA